MNIWSDRIVETYVGPWQQVFEDDSGKHFEPFEVVKLLSRHSEGYDDWYAAVRKILDYDMIWVPENKPLAKKLETLGLTVVMS